MIPQVRSLLEEFQQVYLDFLEVVSTVTDEVFSAKPTPERMSIEENLRHLIRSQRDYITPGLKEALARLRGPSPRPTPTGGP